MNPIPTKKMCIGCNEEFPLTEFYDNGEKYTRSRCINCYNNQTKKWREKNPDYNKDYSQNNSDYKKDYNLKYNYGLTLAEFENLKLQQQNKCAICFENKKLCVDHDHTTKKIRGLLCHECNTAIGLLKENPHYLKSALNHINPPKLFSSITPVVLVCNDIYWVPYVLKSIEDHFKRIVVYDVGSTDGTTQFIEEFIKKAKCEVQFEKFPLIDPKPQLALRNAMIADAETEYYMIVDGDELWTDASLKRLAEEFPNFVKSKKLYGVVNRIEVCENLNSAYSLDVWLPHHRLYHRTCTWRGTHPGERATHKQKPSNEYCFSEDIKMYHMHNTLRSPKETLAWQRIKRKTQQTYHRGIIKPLHLLKEVPILKEKIWDYDINPVLEKLQDGFEV